MEESHNRAYAIIAGIVLAFAIGMVLLFTGITHHCSNGYAPSVPGQAPACASPYVPGPGNQHAPWVPSHTSVNA